MAPLRDKRCGRSEADRRMAKPYTIVRDISTHGSGQWLGGAYLVKAASRESKGNVIVIKCSPNGTREGGDFIDPKTLTRRREK